MTNRLQTASSTNNDNGNDNDNDRLLILIIIVILSDNSCTYLTDFVIDSPDVIFGDHMRKGRSKVYRDSEKVPLGDNDELAMI